MGKQPTVQIGDTTIAVSNNDCESFTLVGKDRKMLAYIGASFTAAGDQYTSQDDIDRAHLYAASPKMKSALAAVKEHMENVLAFKAQKAVPAELLKQVTDALTSAQPGATFQPTEPVEDPEELPSP